MDEELQIRIKAKLDSGVKRALAGVTADVKKADAETVASAKTTQKARTKAVEQYVSSVRRAEQTAKREAFARGREILQDFRANEKKKREELAKTLRETQMSERRRAQLVNRTEREISQQRGRARAEARDALSGGEISGRGRRRWQMAGAAGGALLGATGGALNASQRAQGALGIRSQEELIAAAIDQRQSFITQASQVQGMTPARMAEIMAEVTRVSRQTGVGSGELLAGLNSSQESFSNMDTVVANLESMATMARATQTEFSSVAGAAGEIGRQFGLSTEEIDEGLAIIARGAQEGSLSFSDFAESQSQAFSGFQTARGTSGLEALREFQAVAQSLRAGGLAPTEVRSRQGAFLNTLSDRKTQQRLRRAGVNVTDDSGNIREVSDIINQVRGSRRLQNREGGLSATALRAAFGDQEAGQAVAILAQGENAAATGTGPSLRDRAAASADEGRAVVASTFAALNADASGRAVNMRAGREASVMENSEQLINAFAQVAGPLTELQDEFPVLTQAVTALTSVIGGAGVGGLGGGLLTGIGGGGAAGAVGAGGVGSVAAAGGAAALGAAVAIPAGLAAGGMTVPSSEGDSMFDFWRNVFGGASLTQAASGTGGRQAKTGGGMVDEANTRATEENNRIIREQTAAMRENTAAQRAAAARGADTGAETPVQ